MPDTSLCWLESLAVLQSALLHCDYVRGGKERRKGGKREGKGVMSPFRVCVSSVVL